MTEQNYSNHIRWFPLFHFVVMPLLLIILIWNSVMLYQEPSWERGVRILFVVTVILLALAARLMALTVQNRVIRLEEKLRYASVLSPELYARCKALPNSQVIALRFAPDEELGGLVERSLNGELATTKDIKLAIKSWRADHMRA